MQSRKASNSKKTSKNINEAATSEKKVAAEVTPKPRAPRSSKSKKEVAETPSTKNHRKSAVGASALPASESSLIANTLPETPETPEAPKVMSAAAGFESAHYDSAVIDPVGVVIAPAVDTKTAFASAHEVSTMHHHSREEIANLAYSYWIARGYRHGSADEDWLRAEVELTRKR